MGRDLTTPSTRLTAAAELAAAVLFDDEMGRKLNAIDVGCDHAKIAIYLVQSGICNNVLACDINDGPVKKARENVQRRKFMKEPLEKYITVIQNDGLSGLSCVPADRIFILGMGGELIADILEKSGFVKENGRNIGFVLQAMTSEYELRKYLCINGFDIIKEKLVKDKERIYSVILAIYDGIIRNYSECELTVGKYNIENRCDLFSEYLERKIRIQKKMVEQLKNAGVDTDENKNHLLADLIALQINEV